MSLSYSRGFHYANPRGREVTDKAYKHLGQIQMFKAGYLKLFPAIRFILCRHKCPLHKGRYHQG
jgi:hypothetical protein